MGAYDPGGGARLDRRGRRREALQGYLALPSTGPLKTIAAWKALNKFSQQGVRRYLEVTERMYAGLRKAGMPEH